MLSPIAKRNISRIIPFGLFWLVFSIVYSLLEKGMLGNLGYYPSTGNPYNFGNSIFVTASTSLIVGLFIGTIEILYLSKIFLHRSFVEKIVYKTIIYLVVIISFLWINAQIYAAVQLKTSIFNKAALKNVWLFFTSYAYWSIAVYAGAIILVSLFYSEVSENLGQGVLNNFLTGKYHTPKEEERIFMFLDIKSSTAIAESIGHVKYFEMLREYYSDMSYSIIMFSGEVYQYVGDEIVVSWKLEDGLQNNNCIICFYAIKATMKTQIRKYTEKFGLLPEFKAGFHMGKVTTGEIGTIKKDIIFTGDVVNTAARIQGLCNTYKVDILISGDLMKRLELDSRYEIKSLGENELRGKGEKMELFTILRK